MPTNTARWWAYFEELYSRVGTLENQNRATSRFCLARQMFETRFVWSIDMDENRAFDGLALRRGFTSSREPCSVFEVVLALSNHLSFETSFSSQMETSDWFWRLVDNLGLFGYTDEVYFGNDQAHLEVHDILERFLNRGYEPSGRGGLFPLNSNSGDQRTVELWYQMSSYLLEHEDLW